MRKVGQMRLAQECLKLGTLGGVDFVTTISDQNAGHGRADHGVPAHRPINRVALGTTEEAEAWLAYGG